MSKLIFERRKENQLMKDKEKDNSSFIDKSIISEGVFQVKDEANLKDIENYKKEIDKIFLEKKEKLDKAFKFEENSETIDESTVSYTAILASENSQQALQTALDKNYISEETLQTISDEEKVSVVNLLRYTNVFVNVGLAALVASILLFLLSPMIHRMMHEG